MTDFLQYVFEEAKSNRLSKSDAIDLILQFKEGSGRKLSVLHPLLHSNTSSLHEQRFTSTLTGAEFFLRDHIVQGQRVLPGVAYLEMARAAVANALGDEFDPEKSAIRMENIAWLRPLVVGEEPTELHVALSPDSAGTISFDAYVIDKRSGEETVYARGRAALIEPASIPRLDVPAIRAACNDTADGSLCYAAFDSVGLSLGVAFRGLHKVHAGVDERGLPFAFGELSLPDDLQEQRGPYVLHPSLLDSALQTSIGLALNDIRQKDSGKLNLPFSLGSVEIYAPIPDDALAMVRYSADGRPGAAVQRTDIDVADTSGKVCVRLQGFTTRVMDGVPGKASAGTLLLRQEWMKEQPPALERAAPAAIRLVLVCEDLAGSGKDTEEAVRACIPAVRYVRLQSETRDPGRRYTDYASQLLAQVQSLLSAHTQDEAIVQLAVPSDGQGVTLRGLGALLKSVQLEHPRVLIQTIGMPADTSAQVLAEWLQLEANSGAQDVRYEREERQALKAVEAATKGVPQVPWKDGGIYLITGGAGGLGLCLAEAIASAVKNPVLVLTGRTKPTPDKTARLEAMASRGAHLDFQPADISNPAAVKKLVSAIASSHGRLDGVIHCAGIIRDRLASSKTEAELREVFAPKVAGLVALDEATRNLALDSFILFSSMSGMKGNAGQADYAAANGFMDAYAGYRNGLVKTGKRSGHTLSVNWPLWDGGGMQVDPATRERMQRATGMAPLAVDDGMRALYQALALEDAQVGVLAGDLARLRSAIAAPKASRPLQKTSATPVAGGASASELQLKVENALVTMASGLLKIRRDNIDVESSLDKFGFDSLTLTDFNNALSRKYGLELSPTVFFEYPTLRSLAGHLVGEHHDVIAHHFTSGRASSGASSPAAEEPEEATLLQPRARRGRTRFAPKPSEAGLAQTPEPIAIIGMSGAFPQAQDLDAFWDNLKEGRDCISEIPDTRWDWDRFYGDPAREASKTNVKRAGMMEGAELFDPLFFGISPREAEAMDPQQRLLMTYVWKVIEDAGYSAQNLSGTRTALLVGTISSGYSARFGEAGGEIEGYSAPGATPSVGPNRMSFLLNLHGPSEPIETACSSALVAIHRAVMSINSGESDMAIAGGVNAIISPEVQVSFSKAGMLCEDGRCKTFSAHANGYVRGEGVGMLMLKRLSAAERDADHIYGLIRGSAENHGGRASSLTAPNPRAQAEVIKAAFARAGIDPSTVGYIEAHGTGTPLGDPIEIQGLKTAFKELNEGKDVLPAQYCGIGSVKTNIGHLELSAGVAGVIKVLLQLKHRTLAKSLYSEEINPHIRLEGSPFYIVQESRPWNAPKDANGQALPRRAGVSSFGFGGVNAHVVLEEYVPRQAQARIEVTPERPAVVVLSAKNEERLREQVRQLLQALDDGRQAYTQADLADIAYTLQVGREAMEVRLACLAASIDELKKKLGQYLQGANEIDELYHGEVKRNKDTVSIFAADEELHEAIEKWIERGRLSKLAALWAKGLVFDWNRLYGPFKPRRISLPTYPFARERYWLPEQRSANRQAAIKTQAVLHPLLHRNTSNLNELRFTSIFTGEECFLKDHIVRGQRVLPGVAYLEMARAAALQAIGAAPDSMAIRLENIAWVRPLVVGDEPVEIHIALTEEDAGKIGFECYSEGKAGEDVLVYAHGRAALFSPGAVAQLDIAQLKAGCADSADADFCYGAFGSVGLTLGAAFRGLRRVWAGKDEQGSAISIGELHLPESVMDARGGYALHPSMLDSALQTSIGLALAEIRSSAGGKLNLPFALGSAEILSSLPDQAVVLARYSADGQPGTVPKYDLDIADTAGRICVRLRSFTTRVLDGTPGNVSMETLVLRPEWKRKDLSGADIAPRYAHHSVVLCEVDGNAELLPAAQVLRLSSTSDSLARCYTDYAAQLLQHLQGIAKEKEQGQALVQLVVPAAGEGAVLRGLGGLLKSARQENVKLVTQIIAFDAETMTHELAAQLQAEAGDAAQEVRYLRGCREVLKLEAERKDQGENRTGAMPWRDDGVYLITGGAGRLGLILAQEIASRAKGVTLVLAGRSPWGEDRQAPLDMLRSLGAHVEYRAADVGDAQAVRALVAHIQASHGGLNGIVHIAGIVKDSLIQNKTTRELTEVFAPKVDGAINLDLAARDIGLDFFLLFSSIAGVMGNVGQADYAAANAFLDAFAQYRNELVAQGLRRGRTLSVDWPLWADGGMQVDAAVRERMWRAAGIIPLESKAGIQALQLALASNAGQIAVFAGDAGKIARFLKGREQRRPIGDAASSGKLEIPDASELKGRIETAMVHAASNILKIGSAELDVDAELSEFGFDSITLTAFGNDLNHKYGLELTPTIFFEYPTISSLAGYLAREHGVALAGHFGAAVRATAPATKQPEADMPVVRRRRQRFNPGMTVQGADVSRPANSAEPIAIIGMSGCFPQAPDLEALWRNLESGRDCIGEIPNSRWNWDELYGDPHQDGNKTNIRRAGVIDGVDCFDPLFFGISPREAEVMDPQQRLLMMYVWKAIEDAGYSAQSLSGSNTGLFIGTGASGYNMLLNQAGESIEGYSAPGMVPSVGPNRMSYLLNLHGPSEPIETSCSSSLVAIHRALLSIQAEQCEMAIVGGVNTLISPEVQVSFSKAGMLCEDGRCKTFSAQANGYVRGEGVGMLVLKKLSAAERDGDNIYALIRGSAENHGGRSNSLTAPNPKAQAEVIKAAFRQAGIDPGTVGYIEAHGTGTPLGDPIEVQGLKNAFKELQQDGEALPANYCGLGSIKTNIGHLELAAGVAGVIKVLLQMKHKTLVKSLHSEEINPYIRLDDSPFYIVQEKREWEAPRDEQGRALPRRAGVSSFGFGGVNAHVVLEEYVASTQRARVAAGGPAIVVLSAKNEERLREQAARLRQALDGHGSEDLADIAYTLQVGREAMEARVAWVVGGMDELKSRLEQYLAGGHDLGEFYRGDVKRNKETLEVFTADEDLQRAMDAWIEKGKLSKLLSLWVKGLAFDWNRLYGQVTPRRLSLPTYPFARERYWVNASAARMPGSSFARTDAASARKTSARFDADFFSRLLSETENESLNIEEAAAKAKSALF